MGTQHPRGAAPSLRSDSLAAVSAFFASGGDARPIRSPKEIGGPTGSRSVRKGVAAREQRNLTAEDEAGCRCFWAWMKSMADVPVVNWLRVWDSQHEFGGIFKNLVDEKYYRAVFDLKTDEKKVREFIDRYSLSIGELEEISFQYQNWCSSKATPIKSPRGTLVTFIRNYVNSDKKLSSSAKDSTIESRLNEDGSNLFDLLLDG